MIPDEVIVIESDSDDEVEIIACSTIKRRRLSPRNDLPSSSTPSKPPSRNGLPCALGELKENAPTLTFGKPILLVQPETRTPVKEENTTPLTFGPSTLVARSDALVAGNDCSPPLADSTAAEIIPKDDVREAMKWETGDDEFSLRPQVSEEEKVEETLQETSDDVLDLTFEEGLLRGSQVSLSPFSSANTPTDHRWPMIHSWNGVKKMSSLSKKTTWRINPAHPI